MLCRHSKLNSNISDLICVEILYVLRFLHNIDKLMVMPSMRLKAWTNRPCLLLLDITHNNGLDLNVQLIRPKIGRKSRAENCHEKQGGGGIIKLQSWMKNPEKQLFLFARCVQKASVTSVSGHFFIITRAGVDATIFGIGIMFWHVCYTTFIFLERRRQNKKVPFSFVMSGLKAAKNSKKLFTGLVVCKRFAGTRTRQKQDFSRKFRCFAAIMAT